MPKCWYPSTRQQGLRVQKTIPERNYLDPVISYISGNITTLLVLTVPVFINLNWQLMGDVSLKINSLSLIKHQAMRAYGEVQVLNVG
jgi:hypothetical protein